ncbi:MAG TPA: hypothetical protein EYN66_11545 [Myxococcales bacterium]|nr:hypothetical protein [Myxococcales bacterium]
MEGSKKRIWQIGCAVLLSWTVLFNTLLVSVDNLGVRDGIGYINGGKVFRLQGTMWYHIPGLLDLGLAPQNLGGQINLRNNEFALLEHDLRSVERIEVDVEFEDDAMLLVILDRHSEGNFWALRLTAFDDPESPFVNALVRYERGRIQDRIELKDIGKSLSPGTHTLVIELTNQGQLIATVDDKQQTLPFAVDTLRPKLALGCGERNTTVTRWRVVGVRDGGEAMDWEETFSVMGTLGRTQGNLTILASLLWLLLFGAPLAKVWLEARTSIGTLLTHTLLLPLPRTIFGLLCLIPWMPMLLQWILGGLYIVYAWISLWEAMAQGKGTWKINTNSETNGTRWRWLVAAALLSAISVGLFFAKSALRNSLLGQAPSKASSSLIAEKQGTQSLALGERIALDFESKQPETLRLEFRTVLTENQVLRVDLMASSPPPQTDVYQVDRSQDPAEGSEEGSDDEHSGPSDYEMRAVSVFISTDPGLPSELRWLRTDKVRRSEHGGWQVEPGEHTVVISVSAPLATVAVDGKIVDFRANLDPSFIPGAVQFLTQNPTVKAVGDVRITPIEPNAVTERLDRLMWSNLLGALALFLLILGLIFAAVSLTTGVSGDKAGLLRAAGLGTRAYGLLWLWLIWWFAEAQGWLNLSREGLVVNLGTLALLMGGFNLAQMLRQSDNGGRIKQLLSLAVVALISIIAFEGFAQLQPERRHYWTTHWNQGMQAQHYWVHDPMIRRLNPWFIDMRFKRRDWKNTHPDKTRIVVFGGSQTYGWGIPAMDRMTFSDQLERILIQRGHKDLEVLNAAFPGVKTATGLRWFSGNMLCYQPDVVVINFVVNEFMNVDPYHIWAGEVGPDEPLSNLASLGALKRFSGDSMDSHLMQILVASVYEIYAMEKYLRWWVELARERGIKVVFSIEPTNLYVESGGKVIMRKERDDSSAQALYRRLGKELNIPVYDPLPHFLKEQENMWFYDTMHMSRLGHRVFAENLATLLENKVL